MSWSIQVREYGDPEVVRLVEEVQQEYVRRYGGPDAAAVEPGEFVPPSTETAEIDGSVMFRPLK